MWLEAALGWPHVTVVHIQATLYSPAVSVEVSSWSTSSVVCMFMYAWLCVFKWGRAITQDLCEQHGQVIHAPRLLQTLLPPSWASSAPVCHGTDGRLEMINDKLWIEVGWRKTGVTIRGRNSFWLMYLLGLLKYWVAPNAPYEWRFGRVSVCAVYVFVHTCVCMFVVISSLVHEKTSIFIIGGKF